MNMNKTELHSKTNESFTYTSDFTSAPGFAESVKVQSGVTYRARVSALPVT